MFTKSSIRGSKRDLPFRILISKLSCLAWTWLRLPVWRPLSRKMRSIKLFWKLKGIKLLGSMDFLFGLPRFSGIFFGKTFLISFNCFIAQWNLITNFGNHSSLLFLRIRVSTTWMTSIQSRWSVGSTSSSHTFLLADFIGLWIHWWALPNWPSSGAGKSMMDGSRLQKLLILWKGTKTGSSSSWTLKRPMTGLDGISFSSLCVRWVLEINGSSGFNDVFHVQGLRQMCHLSPLLFNLVVEALPNLLNQCQSEGYF